MRCHKCQATETKVIESRESSEGGSVRRRRECVKCKSRFTTYERVERSQIIVLKNNGTRQLFNRSKVLAGILRAAEKTSISMLDAENMVDSIENKIHDLGLSEIPARQIGDIVMEVLAEKDQVAYVRFASVYKRFKDIASFERELSQIKKTNQQKLKK